MATHNLKVSVFDQVIYSVVTDKIIAVFKYLNNVIYSV